MKKKIFLIALTVVAFTLILAFSVCAAGIDYSEKAVLADGTVVPIYDKENNPLIWYVSGTDENGKNVYASVPNNRNAANSNHDTYVTYENKSGNQLANINFFIYDEAKGDYVSYTEDTLEVVVFNMRGLIGFIYLNATFNCKDIQYIYFHEQLKDCCDYFKGSTNLRLVDLSVCTNMTGGFGGTQNFKGCSNLHTVRLAPGASYSLACSKNNNWRFLGTALVEMVFPENVTSLGVDNFKNSSKLESIYILGNATSLGQRNFYGCSSLTNIYILGSNPTIDVNSFRENFYECVDGATTYDFTGIGKYFFFVTTDAQYLSQVKEAIGATAIITYEEYKSNPSSYAEGRYVISGTNICDVYYGEHKINQETANSCAGACTVCGDTIVNHNEAENLEISISYNGFDKAGTKTVSCKNQGCTFSETEELDALFTCLGYSAPTFGESGGMALGFLVNTAAIAEYTSATGATLTYGVFAAAYDILGTNDVFGENGTPAGGVISAEIANLEFVAFELAIVGFVGDYKNAPLAMGAYVAVTKDGTTTYSYMQDTTKGEKIGNYYFASYNDVIGK